MVYIAYVHPAMVLEQRIMEDRSMSDKDKKDDKRHTTDKQISAEVKADVKEMKGSAKAGKKLALTLPPPPPVKIGDVTNPIIEKRGLKRALVVAIVQLCQKKDGSGIDKIKAQALVRASGIPYKSGYKEDNPSDPLTQSEWSGAPYVRFATDNVEGKVYGEKHKEKVEACHPFAKALEKVTREAVKEAKEEIKEKAGV